MFTSRDCIHTNIITVRISTKPTVCHQGVRSTGNTQWDEALSQLLEMGFEYDQSLEALLATDCDLTKASAMLAQQSTDCGLSSTLTKDTVDFEEDSMQETLSEPISKRRDRGYIQQP